MKDGMGGMCLVVPVRCSRRKKGAGTKLGWSTLGESREVRYGPGVHEPLTAWLVTRVAGDVDVDVGEEVQVESGRTAQVNSQQ